MSVHYHGTPLSPRAALMQMAGKHFCVPFSDPRDADVCQQIGQSVMFDNGAFSAHTKGKPLDRPGYYAWLAPRLGHPHWAVIPDVIDGSVEAQRDLVAEWPFGFARPHGRPDHWQAVRERPVRRVALVPASPPPGEHPMTIEDERRPRYLTTEERRAFNAALLRTVTPVEYLPLPTPTETSDDR